MRTVVVGVDGSEPSLRALLFAASLVEDLAGARLLAVHARYVGYLWSPDHVAEAEFADVLDDAERYVRTAVEDRLAGCTADWSLDVRDGEPAHVLCEVAREVDASFIVAGRRGWTIAEELLLGSVSNRLVHRSTTPVLLVR